MHDGTWNDGQLDLEEIIGFDGKETIGVYWLYLLLVKYSKKRLKLDEIVNYYKKIVISALFKGYESVIW